jgi:putative transcriptional regulator
VKSGKKGPPNVTSSKFLDGKLLLAMPNMTDPRFERSVIYLCSHDESGAMGLIINQAFDNINFAGLLDQLDIDAPDNTPDVTVHNGGPVEPGRGFVLHSADYVQDSTLIVSEKLALTATVDVLSAIAQNSGPLHALLALGYAGWGAGQLEQEIQSNSWLTSEAEDEIIFNTDLEQKWARAMAMLGVNVSMLSSDAGHA